MNHSSKQGVQAVIFDLSGTVLDYGSRGPVVAFIELFARYGVEVTAADARRPMGAHKRDHIWAMLSDPAVAARWEKARGEKPTRELLEKLYVEFAPLQVEVLKRHSEVIPGVAEIVENLRQRGIKLASTTGFDMTMMDGLMAEARRGGFTPDLFVCPDLVGSKGRPAPWMAFYAAQKLDVYPMKTIIKVGDTVADIAEARAAGMWAVSVVRSGNEVGLSQEELAALPAAEQNAVLCAARARLSACGPDYLIDSVADLMPVIDDVTARLVRGEKP
jgi:phosphonoacetaldehyde hydrolase